MADTLPRTLMLAAPIESIDCQRAEVLTRLETPSKEPRFSLQGTCPRRVKAAGERAVALSADTQEGSRCPSSDWAQWTLADGKRTNAQDCDALLVTFARGHVVAFSEELLTTDLRLSIREPLSFARPFDSECAAREGDSLRLLSKGSTERLKVQGVALRDGALRLRVDARRWSAVVEDCEAGEAARPRAAVVYVWGFLIGLMALGLDAWGIWEISSRIWRRACERSQQPSPAEGDEHQERQP